MKDFDIVLDRGPLPTKLNFGCGTKIKEGWFNFDLFVDKKYVDIVCEDYYDTWVVSGSLQSPHALPHNHFTEIYAEMVMEHIHPDMIPNTLYCLYHSLAPLGKLTIIVPNFYSLAKKLVDIVENTNPHTPRLVRNINNEMLDPTFENIGYSHGHQSIWFPDMAKYWLSNEGFLIDHIENFGNDYFYMKVIATKPEGNDYGSPV